jgi:RNA 3'-terminal phosphate cyclase
LKSDLQFRLTASRRQNAEGRGQKTDDRRQRAQDRIEEGEVGRVESMVRVHLADHLALYMALAKGRSSMITDRITEHLKTNIWMIEQFLPVRFEVKEVTGRVSVEGIGLSV